MFHSRGLSGFQEKNRESLTGKTVIRKAFSIIVGTADIPFEEDLYFGNLKHLTDGSITKAMPDFYDGTRPVDLNEGVREQLSEYIEPLAEKTAPLMPNFFTERTGPDGSARVCELRAMYNGALGARGIHKLRSYVDPDTAYDNNAYTITSTFHSGLGYLAIYATHLVPPKDPGASAGYRMTELKAFPVASDPEDFRRGATFLRNARDLAGYERKKLIAAANAKAMRTEDQVLVRQHTLLRHCIRNI